MGEPCILFISDLFRLEKSAVGLVVVGFGVFGCLHSISCNSVQLLFHDLKILFKVLVRVYIRPFAGFESDMPDIHEWYVVYQVDDSVYHALYAFDNLACKHFHSVNEIVYAGIEQPEDDNKNG